MGKTVQLTAADGKQVPAYVAEPSAQPRGAIVVVQEIFGVNSHIRSVADGYAADGYLAIAPATFERVESGVELGYSEADMKRGFALKNAVEALPEPGVMQDLQAAIDHGAKAGGGKVGIVGFCWGGLLTWRAACTLGGLAAAVPYYGGGMTQGEDAKRHARVPVLAHFAEADEYIPLDSAQAFAKAHPEVEAHFYAGHHGFNCDQRGSYDERAAHLARERTLAFFRKHVG